MYHYQLTTKYVRKENIKQTPPGNQNDTNLNDKFANTSAIRLHATLITDQINVTAKNNN